MIEINNLTKFNLDQKFFKKIAEDVLKEERAEKKDLSVAFVGEKRIRGLNKKYRKIDRVTDVLSFPGENNGEDEIIICPAKVRKNAKKYKSTFKKELALVLIHSILHLLGYNHERDQKEAEIMEQKQNYYLQKLWQKK